ncbi:hypothetical protein D3C86_2090810 [compost metagenome]
MKRRMLQKQQLTIRNGGHAVLFEAARRVGFDGASEVLPVAPVWWIGDDHIEFLGQEEVIC